MYLNCHCGDVARHMVMVNGIFVQTCGEYGCKKQMRRWTSANTTVLDKSICVHCGKTLVGNFQPDSAGNRHCSN